MLVVSSTPDNVRYIDEVGISARPPSSACAACGAATCAV